MFRQSENRYEINVDEFKSLFPERKTLNYISLRTDNTDQLVRYLNNAIEEFGINLSPYRRNAFLAQCAVESENFTFSREKYGHNDTTVIDAKIQTCFGKMDFNEVTGKVTLSIDVMAPFSCLSNEREKQQFNSWRDTSEGRKRQIDYLYAGKNGNRFEDDGSKFFGRGFIQITGSETYNNFFNYIQNTGKRSGESVSQLRIDPGLMDTDIELACWSAGWYWDRGVGKSLSGIVDRFVTTEILQKSELLTFDNPIIFNAMNGEVTGKINTARLHLKQRLAAFAKINTFFAKENSNFIKQQRVAYSDLVISKEPRSVRESLSDMLKINSK